MTETARLVIAVDSRQVSQGDSDLARLGKTSSAVEREVKSLTSAVAGLAAPLAAAFSVKAIYDSAEAYSTLTNRLRLVTDGAVALAAAQQSVFTIAQNARQPLEATAELYQRIATNQTALKLSGQGVADIVSTISKTLAISGASAESSRAALVQLGQAFASGTLRGEELNSVMEQAPALSQAIAAGMGKTVGQLRSLGAEGKLTAEEVVKALQKQAGAVDALFGKMTATVGGGLTTIGNSFTNYVGQIDQATGASGKLANEILSVSKAIDGSLPGTLSTLKENASALVQVLETGLYVAAGRVASVFIQQAGAAGVAAVANQSLLKTEADLARQSLLNAQAKQLEAKSQVELAALEIKAAEGRVASDRALQASQIANLKNVQAALSAELALEQQRLKAQITDQGRAASVARMAEVRLAEIAIIKQVEVAERSLSATTIATSAKAATAYAGRTAAVLAFGETTATVNALAAASSKATAAASLTGQALTGLRSAGAGLLGIMGGPVGLAVIAGAVALSFVDFSSRSKMLMGDLGDLGKSVDQVRTEFNKLNEDQQRAQVNTWKDKQLGAVLAVDEAYKDLKSSIQGAMIETPNPDMVDLAKVADQARAYDQVIEKLDAAKASGQALSPILRDAAASGQISPAALKSWEAQAGVVADNIGVVNQINERLDAQTGILGQNTVATQANNQAKAGFTEAGEKYISTLQKQLGKLQDNGDAVKEASRYISEHKDLSEADRAAILSTGHAIKAQDDANKAALKGTRESSSEAKKHATEVANLAKKLQEFLAEAAISTGSMSAMSEAYLAGADHVRELGVQQKIAQETLKLSADAHDKVADAVRKEADAKDRLDIAQSIANMRTETTQTRAQATATLQGKTALEAFNIQKSMSVALSGKNIEYGSKEYDLLLQQTKAQLEANKALEQANSVESIIDRLNPQIKLLRDYTAEQDALNAAIAQGTDKTPLYQDALAKLGLEYEQNKAAATAWGQFTQGAVDRVDDAFADAWKNIDKSFKGFADNLVGGFKQLLAELAHMAITKPIIMQIGASLGVGGLAASAAGGSGGSGIGIGSVLNGASTAYGAVTGWGKAIYTGYQSGGISGAASGLGNYAGGLFSGADQAAGQAIGTIANGGSMTYAPLSYQASNGGAAASGAAGATTYAPWAAAIGGAIMGYQNSGVKGAVAGAAGGFAGAKGGAALGSYFGPIGTAVGAVIGGILGAVGGSKLFGGDWITKDQGIQLSVDKGDFVGNQFEYQKKKGGLFSSNKKRTNLTSLDPEMQKALDDSYAGTLGAVLGVFDSLNVELNDGVLDGLNVAATQISTKDKTAEEIQAELMTWFTDLGDAAVSAVSDATGAGVGNYDFSELQVFAGNLLSINDTFKLLNVNALPVSVWGGKLAEQYVAMAGGMEAFNSAAQSYYSNFFMQTEQADDLLKAVTDQFTALGITLPSSREGFRAMVESIDSTTDSGRSMYTTLIGLNESAASAYTILESRAKEAEAASDAASQAALDAAQAVKDALLGVVSNASSGVSRAVEAERDAATKAYNARVASLNDMSATAAQSVTDLSTVSNSLESALKSLNGTSDDAVKTLRAQAQATLQSALATARAGGSLASFTGLEDALSTVSDNNTDLYSSMEDFARDQGRTANVVAELNAINGKQLTAAEKLQESLETQIDLAKEAYDAQMAQFDQQLEFAQAQMDAFNGIDNSVKSVEAAIRALNGSLVASLAARPATGAGSAVENTAANNATVVDTLYQQLFGRTADAGENKYWADRLSSGNLPYAEIVANMTQYASARDKAALAAGGKVPAYAMGGDHMGGLRLVGENGPELEVTGPSRIFNANQTASMLKGGGDSGMTAAEVRELRREMQSNATYMAQLTKEVADGIDTLVNSGVQINGTVETRSVA